MTTPDLAVHLEHWLLRLRAERRSAETVDCYAAGARRYLSWSTGGPVRFDRTTGERFVVYLLDLGCAPATARLRLYGIRSFAAYLVTEGVLEHQDLARVRPPRVDVHPVAPLSLAELAALIAACRGPHLLDWRDEAVIRLMAETGARIRVEVLAMRTADLDLARRRVTVTTGKGGRGRVLPIGDRTAAAIDRYLRMRTALGRDHPTALWTGIGVPRPLTYSGLYEALRRRAAAAGVSPWWPHRLRHTFAHRWLAAGGTEIGLMTVAGWLRRDMIHRYAASAAATRAAEEAGRLKLGESY